MDKRELYQKAEKALNQAFETAKKSVAIVAEKAGEAAQVTKLLVQKATLEHRVTKQFARLGGCVYEKLAREGRQSLAHDSEVQSLMEETQRLEAELTQIEAALDREKSGKKSASGGTRKTQSKK